ncbi:hypothetical protein O181_017468 [Austropuccinia psidii MF-1]|uniref:Uncharacterized protein n=1 Tax=Austropuccinia psidii MF-1 TaxID=1389203 RepID=A0A9Q3C652_9BASI|nr:hypothetical protein [Austropuccinia psidii MF-1]
MIYTNICTVQYYNLRVYLWCLTRLEVAYRSLSASAFVAPIPTPTGKQQKAVIVSTSAYLRNATRNSSPSCHEAALHLESQVWKTPLGKSPSRTLRNLRTGRRFVLLQRRLSPAPGKLSNKEWETAAIIESSVLSFPQAPKPVA